MHIDKAKQNFNFYLPSVRKLGMLAFLLLVLGTDKWGDYLLTV